MPRLALACLLFATQALAGGSLKVEPAGRVEVEADAVGPRARVSSDGRWLVTAHGAREDKARGAWSYGGFSLVDIGEATATASEARLGRNTPVFSRNARWMAWCDDRRAGAVTIHLRELATGADGETRLELGGGDFTTLCAIDDDGRRAVLAVPAAGRRAPGLLLVDLRAKSAPKRFAELKEPYFSALDYEVALHGDLLIHHTRPADKSSGASYRLLVTDVEAGETRARLGAYVAMATPRYHLTRDGGTLLNGTGDFDVQEVDTKTGAKKTLFNAHKELYSHFLELTLSPDERTLVAWSRGSSTLVVWDRARRQRADIALRKGGDVLGIASDGRSLLVRDGRSGIDVIDLGARRRAGRLVRGDWRYAALDPTGRTLVLGRPAEGATRRWTLELFTLRSR